MTNLLELLFETLPVIIAFIALRISSRRKRISIEILSDTLIPLSKELSEEMQVPIQERTLKQVRLIVTRIRNSGNVTIRADDYLEPIRLKFGEMILSCSVVEGIPSVSIVTDLEVNKDLLALPKVSLRPRNSVTINTVLPPERKEIIIDGRIMDGLVSIAKPKVQGSLSMAI